MLHIRRGEVPNHELAERMLIESIDKGIKVSKNINLVINAYSEKYVRLAREIRLEYGIDNVNSTKQVKEYLLRVINTLPNSSELLYKFTEKNKISFNKNNLKYLYENEGLEVCKLIIEARRYQRIISSLRTFKDLAERNGRGCVYPTVTRGKTNRFNYVEPALMNIAKEVLWYIIEARKKGNKLYSIDIKYQEPWTLVNMLGIISLLEIMKEEPDFYKAVYRTVFNEDCPNDTYRNEIKTAWNAMSYGAYRDTIIDYCHHLDGGRIFDYFDNIPEYKAYKRDKIDRAKRRILDDYTYFGTKVSAGEPWEFKRFGKQQTNRLARVLSDIPIQGTGSDILAFLLEQLNTMNDDLGTEGLIELYYTRHDELILEVDESLCHNRLEEIFTEYFTHSVDDWLPFKVKVSCLSDNDIASFLNNLQNEEEEEEEDMYY